MTCPYCGRNAKRMRVRLESGNTEVWECLVCKRVFESGYERKDYAGHREYPKLIKDNVEVLQIKDGKVVNEYESMRKASKESGVDLTGISRCVNGMRKTAGGYEWKRKS